MIGFGVSELRQFRGPGLRSQALGFTRPLNSKAPSPYTPKSLNSTGPVSTKTPNPPQKKLLETQVSPGLSRKPSKEIARSRLPTSNPIRGFLDFYGCGVKGFGPSWGVGFSAYAATFSVNSCSRCAAESLHSPAWLSPRFAGTLGRSSNFFCVRSNF